MEKIIVISTFFMFIIFAIAMFLYNEHKSIKEWREKEAAFDSLNDNDLKNLYQQEQNKLCAFWDTNERYAIIKHCMIKRGLLHE